MDTKPLERFATQARRDLLSSVDARATSVLAAGSVARAERPEVVRKLEAEITAHGREHVIDKVAYTWFNRIIALRFMDARGYTDAGIVSPAHGQSHGQPEILAEAKRGSLDPDVVSNKTTAETILSLLDGNRRSTDAEGEAYALLLTEHCRFWHKSMPFMFEREGDYTELLVPAGLLADGAILSRAREVLTEDVCDDVEVIGWLYQFYISERKDEVFAGFKKNKKAGADEIPAATQLFTPHWIVRYLVENTVGRLWMLNRPSSRLVDQMEYYIAPAEDETDSLVITSPEDLTVIDPACGSGHMLTYAFDLLYAIYEEEGYAPSEIPSLILINNLHGTEIDPRAAVLAAFALMMKARARQRPFFNKGVKPNICVVDAISFAPDELQLLATADGSHQRSVAFWNQFAAAGTRGALIRPNANDTELSAQRVLQLAGTHVGDVVARVTLDAAEEVIEQSRYLSRRYAAVVANPPYMGTRNMSADLAAWLADEYPDFKSDLFAAFVARCQMLCRESGRVGIMSPNVWMYISTHQNLRTALCDSGKLESLLELPLSGFKGATVQICAYTFATNARPSRKATFLRLTGFGGSADFAVEAAHAINAKTHGVLFVREAASFAAIPGSPVAYWLDPSVTRTYRSGQLLADVAAPRKGMDTGENEAFLRFWWEVSRSRLSTDGTPGKKWYPYNKGGGFRRWYGNRESVINWESDGSAIRARSTWSSRKPTLRNQDYMLREGFSWGTISSGGFSARYSPRGALFDNGGCTLFADEELARLGALVNSSTADYYFAFLAPTLNFQPGDVGKLPIPPTFDRVAIEAERCVEISREDWDSHEGSFDFGHLRLVRGSASLREAVNDELALGRAWVDELRRLEESNNRSIAAAYGLEGVVSCDVPVAKVTLSCNPSYRFGNGGDAPMRQELVAELISYAVGCFFGRYSLDEPGLIIADQGTTLQDYFAEVSAPTLPPDADNVIPFVDDGWFEDDIVERFRQLLRVAFGTDYFEENLRFVEESLGVKTLRDYFITKAGKSKFYDDHVQRYKKRPIYWMFSSPKGSFNALIYMHRYNASTVSTVLNEYLREYRAKLEVALTNADRAGAAGSSKDEREADRLRKVLAELSDYEHDVLYPLATQQIMIDLDDGVKANYPKLYPALRKIAGLEAVE